MIRVSLTLLHAIREIRVHAARGNVAMIIISGRQKKNDIVIFAFIVKPFPIV